MRRGARCLRSARIHGDQSRLTDDHRPVSELRQHAAVGGTDEDEVSARAEELEVGADGEVRVVCRSA